MRDTLRLGADRLRRQAILISGICLLCASTLPAVSYYYVFQHDGMALGPFAWAHWAVAGAACTLAILAHSSGNKVMLAVHAALGAMLGAALGGFDTAFWYSLDGRCATSQMAFTGCLNCPCAANSTCTAAALASDPLCASCTAYPVEACGPVRQEANKFVLAFTGLSAVVFLALPAFYSLLALGRLEASGAAAAAKRQMVCFAVDQQTALVESGEKPTVTPAMLGAWVAFLADSGEPDCAAIGAKCRAALAARNFELPVPQKPGRQASGRKGIFGKKGGGRGGGGSEVAVTAGSGQPPAAEAYAAAEAGRGAGSRKGSQVAAEQERKSVQFVVA